MSQKRKVVFEMMGVLKLQRLIAVELFALLFALLFGGCGDKKAKEVATTQSEQKKAKLLKEIDRKYENPQAHFELGQRYQADGLWSQAEHEYAVTLNFEPVNHRAQAARVKALREGGDTTKAGLLADEYIERASASASAALHLGLAFQEQGLDEYALSCYRQALQLAPNSAKINRQIGYYYLSKGDKVQAKDYLTRSFQLDPLQPEVAGELGRLGVPVIIPRKTVKDTKKLDKVVEQADKKRTP